jgi:hypothetical protein
MSKFMLAFVIAVTLVAATATGWAAAAADAPRASALGAPGGVAFKALPAASRLSGLGDGDEDRGVYCGEQAEGGDAKLHPAGEKLAQYFEVDYEKIMGHFCGGLGFGEIALGYKIAEAAGVDPEEVFAAREDGLGWGLIKKEFGLKDKPWGQVKDKPNKGDDHSGNSDHGNGDKGNNKGGNGKNNGKGNPHKP